MKPAFSSTRQAVAFGLLLAMIIALPAFAAWTGWFKIVGRYPWFQEDCGPFPAIEHRIFADTNVVDIAFMGSSRIYSGINTPYVEQQLSDHLHREAEVFTLGWSYNGYDILYFIAHDLLDHRHVKMLVIYDELQRVRKPGSNTDLVFRTHSVPDRRSAVWYWRGQDLAALGLIDVPVNEVLAWYGTAIINMPRYLVDLFRPNEPFLKDWHPDYLPQVINSRGTYRRDWGWGESKSTFTPYDPAQFPATSADAVVYSEATRGIFKFTGPPLDAYNLYFTRKLAQLCQERGTELVVLHIPLPVESQMTTIPETQCWPQALGAPVGLIGIPGAKLFANRPPDDVRHLFYYNEWHLNRNGQDLFTPLVTPALIKLYDSTTNHF